MKIRSAQLIRWTPRVVTILLIAFFLLMSFDVFEMDRSVGDKIIGFLIHSSPAMLLTVALIVSWKKPLVGSAVLFALAIVSTIFFNVKKYPIVLGVVTTPILLSGILFLADGLRRKN